MSGYALSSLFPLMTAIHSQLEDQEIPRPSPAAHILGHDSSHCNQVVCLPPHPAPRRTASSGPLVWALGFGLLRHQGNLPAWLAVRWTQRSWKEARVIPNMRGHIVKTSRCECVARDTKACTVLAPDGLCRLCVPLE